MKNLKLFCLVLICNLACALSTSAQEKGYWRAASTTAKGTTGDVAFSDIKISINYSAFTIAQIRSLQPAEAHTLFNTEADVAGVGNVYRLSIPASRQFLHHNTLCGSDETQWVISFVTNRNLKLAFFSGSAMPVFTPEAMANATNLCGTYSYVR